MIHYNIFSLIASHKPFTFPLLQMIENSRIHTLYSLIELARCDIFVRDGIHSDADYNSTLMGVVVVVVVVVYFFHDGIT